LWKMLTGDSGAFAGRGRRPLAAFGGPTIALIAVAMLTNNIFQRRDNRTGKLHVAL